jgi:hypothetical protein
MRISVHRLAVVLNGIFVGVSQVPVAARVQREANGLAGVVQIRLQAVISNTGVERARKAGDA